MLLAYRVPAALVVQLLVDATLVMVIGFLLTRLLAKRSAATRCGAWLLAMVAVLVTPALPSIPWEWQVPLLPSEAFRYDVTAFGGDVTRAPITAAVPRKWDAYPVVLVILLVWVAGAVVMLAGLSRARKRIREITFRAELEARRPIAVDTAMARVATKRERAAGVRVLVSEEVTTPLVWGTHRPVILLPPVAMEWTTDRLAAVLAHEMAHVRRRDYLGWQIVEIARSVYWMNPLVWLAARQIRAEQEQACDDAVLRAGIKAADYARHLLEVARHATSVPRASLAIGRESSLRSRVRHILNERTDRRPASRAVVFASLMVFVPLTPALAGLDPWDCEFVEKTYEVYAMPTLQVVVPVIGSPPSAPD